MTPARRHGLFHAGFWALAFAGALLLFLARVQQPYPQLQPGAPHGFQALTQGVLAGQDTLTHDYPAYWWGWRQIRDTHQLPLWNPSWFCGIPFIATQTFMPFYPGNWLGAVLPFPLAFNIQYPLHLWLAAVVMLLCLRRRGVGWWAAGMGAIAWGFGSHLATLAGPGHIQKLQTLAWLPLVTLGWRECALALRLPGRVRFGVACLGLGLALEITAGHPQILYFSLVAGACEALLVLFGYAGTNARTDALPETERLLSQDAHEFNADEKSATHKSAKLRWRAVLVAFPAAAALGLGLGAILWVPSAEFAKLSNRQGTLSWDDATHGSLPPEETLEFAIPRLRGDSLPNGRGYYQGRYGESATSGPERKVSDYVGWVTLALAAFALFAGGPRRRAALGFLAFAAAVLILSYGRYLGDAYRTAMWLIPGLAHLRSPSTMLALMSYGFANAAALGAESLLAPTRPQLGAPLPWRWRVYGPAVLFIIVLGSLFFLAAIPRIEPEILAHNPELLRRVLRQMSLRQVAPVALGALGLLAVFNLAWFLSVGEGMRQGLKWAVLLILPLASIYDLAGNALSFWNAEPVAQYHSFLTTFWPMQHWAREDQPVRYYEYGNELTNRALTLSDYPALREVATLHGYHPVGYQRYFDLLRNLGFASPQLNENLLRLFAINYLLWPEQGGPPLPAGYFEIARMGGKRLLYNKDIVFVQPIEHMRFVPSESGVIERLASPGFNVYDSATLLANQFGIKTPRGDVRAKPLNLQANVFTRAPGELRITVHAATAGTAIVSVPAVPGWRVFYDDLPSQFPPAVANGFFQMINVADGVRIDLKYDPVSQRFGLYLTCVSLALLGFGLTRHRYHKPLIRA